METNRLNNFKNHLEQYNEKFTILNEDNLITATSVKFTEPTIEEKELDLIKFHQKMLKNNNIQLMNKFKETKRNEIKKYKESHRKKEANKPITPYRQEIINTLNNPANGFNLALTLNFNPVNLSGLFNLQMVQNKVDEWWKLYCAYTLGRDASKYKTMNYIGTVEHFESNNGQLEDGVRDHLRGFSRTIPSFLMAYGNENTTLENFDTIIPDEVFKEVTSISLEEFRFLRDGGDYVDEQAGETKHFEGQLFDPVVFNDSVKEFLSLKTKLGNYFDENQTEDIFDYIPPQKTNQIYTPKKVVIEMVDMLEQENPNCFDDENKTFIDLYMKSGLYITEIVKRLYRSEKLKKLYPDRIERLKHIFEKQVYGLAPTEIIYRIAIAFILGDDTILIKKHNLRQFDTLPSVQAGTLETDLDEVFG